MNRRISRLTQSIEKLEPRLETWRNRRLILGLAGFASLMMAGLSRSNPTWMALGLPFLALFALAVGRTIRIERFLGKLRSYKEFLDRQKQRQEGTFRARSTTPSHLALSEDEQALCEDLALSGASSVMGLLDECLTERGRQRLLQTLVSPLPSVRAIRARQEIIKKLAPFHWPLFRLQLQAKPLRHEESADRLVAAIANPLFGKGLHRAVVLQLVVWSATFLSVVLSIAGVMQPPLAPIILAYIIFTFWHRQSVGSVFQKALDLAVPVDGLLPLYRHIEERLSFGPFQEILPRTLKEQPSKLLSRVGLLVSLMSTQGHPLVHLTISVLLPWEFLGAWFLERWRQQSKDLVPVYLNELEAFEVFSCLTFLSVYQKTSFPQISEERALSFENLRHPLLPQEQAVANSFAFPPGQNLGLITGSNMSGKSTFLRTVGVNQVLAMAGAPVFADALTTYLAPVKTCLRVTDAMDKGYSTFYYEVRRIRDILSQTQKSTPCIYLIDEIFRGTNNRERLQGGRSVLKALSASQNALGFVTTHDLDLADLAVDNSNIGNWHFRDDFSGNGLSFSYKIQPGPCPTTNALKIMAIEGLPISPEG